jgi:hypothetical protein
MKYDFKRKIERFKVRLVAKGFTQRERLIIQKPSLLSPRKIESEL